MDSMIVYRGADRSWMDDVVHLRTDILQGLANSMRAQQLFWFEGEVYFRTEGYDIYRINTDRPMSAVDTPDRP